MTQLVIVGAGGHGREAALTAQTSYYGSKFESFAFLDDSELVGGSFVHNIPVVGSIENSSHLLPIDKQFICAVGSPTLRQSFVNRLLSFYDGEVKFGIVVHDSVLYSKFVSIGYGTMIFPGTIITTNVSIGNHVSINLDCTISHDVVIEDFVNLSPGVRLCGGSKLRRGCDLGASVTVIPRVEIGEGAVIGAGACVISDIPPNSLAVGVPARVVRNNLNGGA